MNNDTLLCTTVLVLAVAFIPSVVQDTLLAVGALLVALAAWATLTVLWVGVTKV